jgi:ABC-type spermidine/putrescine transport system permease subunit I
MAILTAARAARRTAPSISMAGSELARLVAMTAIFAFFVLFYLLPMFRLLLLSFLGDGHGGLSWTPTGRAFASVVSSPLFVPVILDTLKLSALVTLLTLLLGYPVAYLLATTRSRYSTVLLLMVLLPLWTSILVRTYAWIVILQRSGLINKLLLQLGLIDEPLNMIFNEFAVIVGSTHILLPFMILPIFGVLRRLDPRLVPAAIGLGASPRRAFWKVTVPLSLPGVAAGVLIVFIMALGFFITPAVLGGGKVTMLAMAIEQQISQFLNWEVAAALSAILLVITLVFVLLYQKAFGFDRAVHQ